MAQAGKTTWLKIQAKEENHTWANRRDLGQRRKTMGQETDPEQMKDPSEGGKLELKANTVLK